MERQARGAWGRGASGRGRAARGVALLFALVLPSLVGDVAWAQTAQGEIEGRASPVQRRRCLGGANAGSLCNENADCPASTCRDRNVFSLSVAVHYNAPAADLTAIENMITALSGVILDVTDGQAEVGMATIHNDAAGTTQADLRVYPATCTTGPTVGAACATNANCGMGGACGVWWQANTGNYRNGGSMHVSINFINAQPNPGPVVAHEFVHLVFDPRDEYESRPGCGANTGAGNCPHATLVAAGQAECLMDSNVTELCWGHGDPANLADATGGNHDATDVTEQSQCRSNRSCWDQVVWSWPNTFLKPAAAPDPGANGAVVGPTNFVRTNDTVRVVLVLDESGSMALESPSRIDRLKVAASDFIALANDNAEVGIVSFASDADPASGRTSVAVGALGTNRAAWTNAITGLAPSTRTNIGDGLARAKTLIDNAGGATGSTYIVLMTDGINNEPTPQTQAAAHLQAQLDALLTAGIPVYVTCTGGDLGLQSQCSEIAAATNGFYVDAADAGQLPRSFVDLHERIAGREAVHTSEGRFARDGEQRSESVMVDPGSEVASFTLQWNEAQSSAGLFVTDPDGNTYKPQSMPQGRFVRVARPKPGMWKVEVKVERAAQSPYVLRAWVRNPVNNLMAAVRYPRVLPGEEMYVYAFPRGPGGGLTQEGGRIVARVLRPDGTQDSLELHDRGRDALGKGDDVPGDAVFTGVYRRTALKGAYTFTLGLDADRWLLGHDGHENDPTPRAVRFQRALTVSAAVGDPNDRVQLPEDDKPRAQGCDPCTTRIFRLLALLFVVLVLGLMLLFRCACRRGTLVTPPTVGTGRTG